MAAGPVGDVMCIGLSTFKYSPKSVLLRPFGLVFTVVACESRDLWCLIFLRRFVQHPASQTRTLTVHDIMVFSSGLRRS